MLYRADQHVGIVGIEVELMRDFWRPDATGPHRPPGGQEASRRELNGWPLWANSDFAVPGSVSLHPQPLGDCRSELLKVSGIPGVERIGFSLQGALGDHGVVDRAASDARVGSLPDGRVVFVAG